MFDPKLVMVALLVGCGGPSADPRLEEAEQASEAFWEAARDRDVETLEALDAAELLSTFLADNEVLEVSTGEPFTVPGYVGVKVPYQVTLRAGDQVWIKRHDLALRDDNEAGRFEFDGGI
jgi:hypothetical protein